ncbi:MAG: COQ9 family protein, partial [Sphingomonadales bacterium]
MSLAPLPADPTLDEIRDAIARRLAANAAFDGWSEAAVESSAFEVDVDPDLANLALKGGAMELIDAWIGSVDAEMVRRLPPDTLNAMKIRNRITSLIATRLDIMAPDREGLRRAQAIMAMPQN